MSRSERNSSGASFRKTRWVLLIGAAVLIALVLVQDLWTVHQRNRLLAAVQKHRAAGEPVLPEDFAPPTGEGADNPVPEWRAAVAAIKPLPPDLHHRADWKELSVPLTAAEDDFLRQVLEGQQEALAHAEKASRMHGKPEWHVHLASPTIDSRFPDLTAQRELAKMLQAAALDAHFHGDDSRAVERLLEIVSMSHSMEHHPTLVAHLVAIGLEALACGTAWTIGPELRVGTAADSSAHPASPAQVRQLMAALLDDRPIREGQVLAFRTERMTQVETTMAMAEGRFGGVAVSSWRQTLSGALGAPRFYGDARILLEYTSDVLKAAQAARYPSANARIAALADPNTMPGVSRVMASLMLPAFQRAILQDFRILTDTRLTAVLLACRMYAQDHTGHLPESLDQLVPDYLASIPADPFTIGSALRYRTGSDPAVYSVGENGIDDAGSAQPVKPNANRDHWDQLDAVAHLKPQPRQAPPEDVGDSDAPIAATQSSTKPATAPANL